MSKVSTEIILDYSNETFKSLQTRNFPWNFDFPLDISACAKERTKVKAVVLPARTIQAFHQ